jgi:hypothetical protein
MATGFPVKANYATGDILTATNMNDLAGTVNLTANATPTTATQMAGKNKIINGDMNVWQRGTSFSLGGGNTYTADRWGALTPFGDVVTASQQAFTAGAAPVTGYESAFFLRFTRASGTSGYYFSQKIESVRTFAAQTVTVSFWAKASVGFTPSNIYLQQDFGTSGSSAVGTYATSLQPITTAWARYSYTIAVPSITGKTIGTGGDDLQLIFNVNPGTASSTVDIWGVQVEAGSTATAFQTASGSLQGELALCQRYYKRFIAGGAYGQTSSSAYAYNTILAVGNYALGTTMRTTPSSVDSSTIAFRNYGDTVYALSAVTLDATKSTPDQAVIYGTVVGAVAGNVGTICANNNTVGYIGFSAEL